TSPPVRLSAHLLPTAKLRFSCVRSPLETQLASPNRVLEGGSCLALTRPALRALLRRNFALRSESIGCSCAHSLPEPSAFGPVPFASTRRASFFFNHSETIDLIHFKRMCQPLPICSFASLNSSFKTGSVVVKRIRFPSTTMSGSIPLNLHLTKKFASF